MSVLERHEEMFDKCIDSLNMWKALVLEYFDVNEKEAELAKLKNIVKGYCEIDIDFDKSEKALKQVEETSNNENENFAALDINKLYQENLNEEPQSSSENYQNSYVWEKVFQDCADVEEVVVKKKKQKVDSSQFEELNDSVMCSNIFTPPIDPISKTIIRNPYKNKNCKHVYENSTIVDYIKQTKNKARCPYIGCNNIQLRMSDIVQDNQLQVQITQYLETQTSTSDED